MVNKKLKQQYMKEYMKKYYWKNKDKSKRYYQKRTKEYRLLQKYGINFLKKEEIIKKQNYICPICLKIFDKKEKNNQMKPVIDQCPKTKQIRGIIHMKCKHALRLLKYNSNFFVNAANYLRQFQ